MSGYWQFRIENFVYIYHKYIYSNILIRKLEDGCFLLNVIIIMLNVRVIIRCPTKNVPLKYQSKDSCYRRFGHESSVER